MQQSGTYRLQPRQLLKLLCFGLIGWLPAMAGVILLASGHVASILAAGLGLLGGTVILALSLWRSISWQEPLLQLDQNSSCASGTIARSWASIANPRANYANRWAMYEDLTAWVGSRNWVGKSVAEIGTSNGALRSFMDGANYKELCFPQYDVQNLHQIPNDEFDLVILDQTLEHLENPHIALKEIRRVLRPGAFTIVTTPFLIPVHEGATYGDYYRWTPQGMKMMLTHCGFDPKIGMWGNLQAAKALLEDMYMTAEKAFMLGLSLSASNSNRDFPITVWAIAKNLKRVENE